MCRILEGPAIFRIFLILSALAITLSILKHYPEKEIRQDLFKFMKLNQFFTTKKTTKKNHIWTNKIPLTPKPMDENKLPLNFRQFPYPSYYTFNGDLRDLKPRHLQSDYSLIPLEQDFYSRSCPSVEKIVRGVVREMYAVDRTVVADLLRLVFNDCFVMACDASVLLDSEENYESEKDFPANKFLKDFKVIDTIKLKLESVCPGIVSCSDIIVLAAREAVLADGGPDYPLLTGRKDSFFSFPDMISDIPSPFDNISKIMASFEYRNFYESEAVCLMGSLGIGMINCAFLEDRLYDFSGTGKPDPSLDPKLLEDLKSQCPRGTNTNINTDMNEIEDEERSGSGFGRGNFKRLKEKKRLVLIEKEIMGNANTRNWVWVYAMDPVLFRRRFAQAMMHLSQMRVLTGPWGIVRKNCSEMI